MVVGVYCIFGRADREDAVCALPGRQGRVVDNVEFIFGQADRGALCRPFQGGS